MSEPARWPLLQSDMVTATAGRPPTLRSTDLTGLAAAQAPSRGRGRRARAAALPRCCSVASGVYYQCESTVTWRPSTVVRSGQ